LADRLFRQNLIDQQGGAFGHASRTTTGAESAPLATESDQMFMVTLGALQPQKSVLQTAAFEVVSKFLFYVQGQVLALRGHHIPKRGVVPLDNVIEQRLFRPVTFIRWAYWRSVRDRCLRHSMLHSVELSIFSQCSLCGYMLFSTTGMSGTYRHPAAMNSKPLGALLRDVMRDNLSSPE
jgi:hypothetical protein